MDAEQYCRADDVALRNILGEHFLIVLHAGESKMFSLNGMGLWFWQRLQRPSSRAELLSAMTAEYDVGESVALAEIDRFLQDLLTKGLVRLA